MNMDRDQDRLDDNAGQDGESEEQGWYFDLPKGAWERQEAKNRELRERILRNMSEGSQKRDVFDPHKSGERDDRGKSRPGHGRSEPAGSWRTSRHDADDDSSHTTGDRASNPDEWSTEPDVKPLPLRLRSRSEEDDDRQPLRLRGRLDDDPGQPEGADDADQPRSRWADAFSAPPEGGMLESMRAWAAGDDAEEHGIAEPDEDRLTTAQHLSLVPDEPEAEAPASDEPAPRSRWEELFGQPPEGAPMLDGMRAWAHRTEPVDYEPEEPGEKPPPAFVPAPVHEDVELAAPPPRSRWDEMFGPHAEGASMLDGMRDWTKQTAEDVPEEPPRRFVREDEPARDWQTEPAAAVAGELFDFHDDEPASAPEAGEPKKKGFIGRLFGRKKEEPPSRQPDAGFVAGDTGDWLPPAPTAESPTAGVPLFAEATPVRQAGIEAASFGPPPFEREPDAEFLTEPPAAAQEAEPAAVPSWSPDDWSPEPPDTTVVPGAFEPQPADAAPWQLEETAVSEVEPVSAVPAAIRKDDDGWDPEPFEPTALADPSTTAVSPAEAPDEVPAAPVPGESPAVAETEEQPALSWQMPAVESEPEPDMPTAVAWESPIDALEDAPVAYAEEPASSAAPSEPESAAEEPAAIPAFSWQLPSAEDAEPEPDMPTARSWDEPDGSDGPANFEASVEAGEPPVAGAEAPEALVAERLLGTPTPETVDEDDPWAAFVAPHDEPRPPAAQTFDSDTEPEPATAGSFEPAFTPDDEPWRAVARDEGEPAAEDGSAPTFESPVPASASPAAATADDDPWAAFIAARDADEPESPDDSMAGDDEPGFASPAEEEPVAPIASTYPTGPVDEPEPQQEPDDPWAAIAAASGYEASSPDAVAIYRGRPGREPEPAPAFRAETAWEDGEAAADEPEPASFRPLPDWAGTIDEDDVILKAFEAHAQGPVGNDSDDALAASVSHEEPMAFEELLGEGASELVSEVTSPEPERHSFARLQGWAPQRSLSGDNVPRLPWDAPKAAPAPSPDDEFGGWRTFDLDDPGAAPGDLREPVAAGTRRSSRTKTLVRELVETGLLALLVFLAVRAGFQNFKVDGNSMSPTLEDGQFLIVNKLAYSQVDMEKLNNFVPFVEPGDTAKRDILGGPERGDIVVLRDPRKPDTDLIKRIIALPGESIEIVNDDASGAQVYIDDYLLQEPYIKTKWHDNKARVTVPEGYYFVMGDNRDNSLDSRSQQVGLVPRSMIIGKAMLSYWPTSQFGLAPNQAGNISVKDGRPQLTAQRIER